MGYEYYLSITRVFVGERKTYDYNIFVDCIIKREVIWEIVQRPSKSFINSFFEFLKIWRF